MATASVEAVSAFTVYLATRHKSFDAERYAQKRFLEFDPDLSAATDHVKSYLQQTDDTEDKIQVVRGLIFAGGIALIEGFSTEDGQMRLITPEKTQSDIRLLQNIAGLWDSIADQSDKKLTREAATSALTLFSMATGGNRPDLPSNPEFPWRQAIDVAVTAEPPVMANIFPFRFAILSQAPGEVVSKQEAERTQENKRTALGVLVSELPLGDIHGDYRRDPKWYRFVESYPVGSLSSARAVLYLALQETGMNVGRVKDSGMLVPEELLTSLVQSARRQWEGLSDSDRGNILVWMFVEYADQVFEKFKEEGHSNGPQEQIRHLFDRIIKEISEEGKETLKSDAKQYLLTWPTARVSNLLSPKFPGLVQEVEKYRPIGGRARRLVQSLGSRLHK